MRNILIILLSFIGTLTLANTERNLQNSNEKTVQKIKYYENKLFNSSNIDISPLQIYWDEAFRPQENNFLLRRYVSYELTEPASPFVILVIPFQKLIISNNRNGLDKKLKN